MQFLVQQTLQQQYHDATNPDIYNVPETKVINSEEYSEIVNLKYVSQKIWNENKLVIPDLFYKNYNRFYKAILTDSTIYCDFAKTESEFEKNFFSLRERISNKLQEALNPYNENYQEELDNLLKKGKWDLEDRRKYEGIITKIIKDEIDKFDFFKFLTIDSIDNRDLSKMKKGSEFDCEHLSILYGLMLQFTDQKLLPETPDYDAELRRTSSYLYVTCKTEREEEKTVGGHATVFSSLTRSIINQGNYYNAVTDYSLKDLYDGGPIVTSQGEIYAFCSEDVSNHISGKQVRNKSDFFTSVEDWFRGITVKNNEVKMVEKIKQGEAENDKVRVSHKYDSYVESMSKLYMGNSLDAEPKNISLIEVNKIIQDLKGQGIKREFENAHMDIPEFEIINNKIGDDYIKFNNKSYKVTFDDKSVKKGKTEIKI